LRFVIIQVPNVAITNNAINNIILSPVCGLFDFTVSVGFSVVVSVVSSIVYVLAFATVNFVVAVPPLLKATFNVCSPSDKELI